MVELGAGREEYAGRSRVGKQIRGVDPIGALDPDLESTVRACPVAAPGHLALEGREYRIPPAQQESPGAAQVSVVFPVFQEGGEGRLQGQ